MKTFGSRLRKLFWFLFSLLLLFAIVLLAALQWPGLWLKPRTLEFAKNQINRRFPQYQIQWTHPQVQTETLGLFSDRLLFTFADFCFKKENQIESCFRSVQLGFAYSLPQLRLLEIGPLHAQNGKFSFRQIASENQKASSLSSAKIPSLPHWLSAAVIKPISIEIQNYDIQAASRRWQGSVLVSSEIRSERAQTQFSLKTSIDDSTWGQIQADAISSTDQVKGPWRLQSFADLTLHRKSTLHAEAEIHPDANAYAFEVLSRFRSSGPKADLKWTGFFKENRLSSVLNGKAKAGPEVHFQNCQIEIIQQSSNQVRIQSDCPVMLPLAQVQKKNVKIISKALRRPSVGARVVANLETAFPPGTTEPVSGNVQISPISTFENILKTQGGVDTQFQMRPSDLPQFESLNVDVNFSSRIEEFQRLVKILENSPMAVPAPFHVLTGPIRLKAQGHFGEKGGRILSLFQTQLQSEHQRLFTQAQSQVEVKMKNLKPQRVNVKSDVLLGQIQLVLPPIEKSPPSQLVPDKRIRHTPLSQAPNELAQKSKTSPFPLTYEVHIHTLDSQPIRLVSSTTTEPVSMGVNLNLKDHQPVRGTLDLNPVKYDVAGIQGTTGGLELSVRSTEYQSMATGQVTGSEGEEKTNVIVAKDPMESLVRPQPKLPIPVLELATAMGLKDPLSVAIVDQRQPNPPQTQANFNQIPLQIRRRF